MTAPADWGSDFKEPGARSPEPGARSPEPGVRIRSGPYLTASVRGLGYPGDGATEGASTSVVCLQYNPGPGAYKLTADFPGAYITRVVWRGEC
ncbi:hypothetical protein [Streptomyces vilmorinianum]|uniref:hypothetical protein n=1 Tax=Streptomyces vilmorinianum TaxID=3051092 RepID=UPI001586B57A|nr:hypothetical protein [Streptomyces vilmorinianum]